MNGLTPTQIPSAPANFNPLAANMTWPFGQESANGPANGANTMYAATKNSCSTGCVHTGYRSDLSKASVQKSSALSASADTNCAASVAAMPRDQSRPIAFRQSPQQ